MTTALPPISRPNSNAGTDHGIIPPRVAHPDRFQSFGPDDFDGDDKVHGNNDDIASSRIPPGKAQSYIAIFEDALEQLAVLGDIGGSPDVAAGGKTDNRAVGMQKNKSGQRREFST